MYSACKWLFKKCPNVIVLVAGMWIASLPHTFYYYAENNTPRILSRFDVFLIYIHDLPLADTLACVIFFAGAGIAITGLAMIVRPWMNPR